jgi:hypothetical protein
VVFPWKEAGPQAFRHSLRKPFGFADESGDPAGAFANRVAIPVPSPSFPLKDKYQK